MKQWVSKDFGSMMLIMVAATVSGALSGAIAGWTFADTPWMFPQEPKPSPVAVEEVATSTTYGKEPDITIVSVDRAPVEPVVPPAFADRRVSSMAALYRKPPKGVDVFREEDVLGQAVALTSDGWFVVPLEAVKDRALADMVLWFDGKSTPIARGIADNRGSVAFLKVDRQNFIAPAFARFQDIARGTAVWAERRSGGFESMTITSLGSIPEVLRGVSSDVASRRGALSGMMRQGDLGAAVWGTNGSLIGLMAGVVGQRATFIPASTFAPSLYGIFSDGTVLHASLGVYAVDLANIRLANPPEYLPERGAWLVGDASKNLPAIMPDSPASRAGLREGDVIQRVDRDILDGRADLGEILVQYKPNSQVTLTVVRGQETLEIPVTLGSKPVSTELK